MKTLLKSLGFSRFEAEKVYGMYGGSSLELLKSESGRAKLTKIVEESSVEAAHLNLCRTVSARKLFRLFEEDGIPKSAAYKFFLLHGENEEECLDAVQADPYSLVYSVEAAFPAVDRLAGTIGFSDEADDRTKAAVYSAITLAEKGLEEPSGSEIDDYLSKVSGSLCLPKEDLIQLTRLLLAEDLTTDEQIFDAAIRLHREKKALITSKTEAGKRNTYVYTKKTADVEFFTANEISRRLDLNKEDPLRYDKNPFEVIDTAQAVLNARLSYEQVNAVYTALTSRFCVITGGPGTGKTATQKVLLESFRRLSHNAPVLLMAPTGQAANRMTEATGYPASTIHSALRIKPGEDNPNAGRDLNPGLIIVDESSMVDASLFNMLIRHISDRTILVIVGDIDQLPSIGAGAVLREMIKCVPTARLTKVFRQGDDSDIAFNAARIRTGTKQMITGEKFWFVEASGSDNIQKAVCEQYKKLSEQYGPENVIVLTPFRRSTPTGVNELNVALRNVARKEDGKYVEYDSNRIYEGDKILFLRNRKGLVNGDVGYVESIKGDSCKCIFGEKSIILSGTELNWIIPAYSQTIHKSQGAEYQNVILVSDPAHSKMNDKSLIYTAITRSKARCVVVGEQETFEKAVERTSNTRFSNLGLLTICRTQATL